MATTHPAYLIVSADASSEPEVMTVQEPTPADYEFADVGMRTIIRLSDMRRYKNNAWTPIRAGKLTRASRKEFPNDGPFHVARK